MESKTGPGLMDVLFGELSPRRAFPPSDPVFSFRAHHG